MKRQVKTLHNIQITGYKLPIWKRIMDIFFSLFAIILLSPVLIFISLAIRIESRGKIFYASQRVGAGYKIFSFYKFRSMYIDADQKLEQYMKRNQYKTEKPKEREPAMSAAHNTTDEGTTLVGESKMIPEQVYLEEKKAKQENSFFKMVNDPRITKVGRFIRNTSLDELPQLFNILIGDMSVVGNRPLPLYEAELLTTDRWIKRFLAPAGLTGLWQVTKRGGAHKMSPDERKQLDIEYVENYSFWYDLKIILKTIPAMVQHENV